MQALILKILTFLFTMPFLAGYRTYIVAAGLLGKAIYDVSVGEFPQAVTDFLGFLAAVGVRAALATGQVSAKAPLVALALLLAASGGQAQDFTETLVGEVGPPVVSYYTTQIQDLAKKEKRPLVLFRGGAKPRHIVRARCCYDFPNAKPDILVAAVADPTQMSACLPGDATDEQIYEAVKKSIAGFVMHAPAATAPSCTGQGCDCGAYGGRGSGCGCDAWSPAINCPRPLSQYQLQPLPLRTGLIRPGCANGSCPGGR